MTREIAGLFAEIPKELSPGGRYKNYHEWRQRHFPTRPRTYVSTAITSGGYAHLADKTDEQWVPQTIEKNKRLGEFLLELLQNQGHVGQELVILPTDIGKIPSWGEFDYMLFWFFTIAGIEPGLATQIDAQIRQYVHPDMGNHALPNEMRRPYYEQFTRLFLEQTAPYMNEAMPVENCIRLLDCASSLGGYAEYLLATALDIPVKSLILTDLGHDSFNGRGQEILELKRAGASIPAFQPTRSFAHREPVVLFSQLPLPRVKDIK